MKLSFSDGFWSFAFNCVEEEQCLRQREIVKLWVVMFWTFKPQNLDRLNFNQCGVDMYVFSATILNFYTYPSGQKYLHQNMFLLDTFLLLNQF